MGLSIDAARARASVGEITDAMEKVNLSYIHFFLSILNCLKYNSMFWRTVYILSYLSEKIQVYHFLDYSFQLTAVFLYASSHRQDSTYYDLYYTSREALDGPRSSSVSPWWEITPRTSTLPQKEGNVLFNDALNTFYLRLYGVRHVVKYHSDSERGNPLPPHGLLLPINSKGYFICIIPQTGWHIPRPLLHQSWSTGWNEK